MRLPFVGYKLQFELNARHHNIKNADAAPHPHTFTISLYLKKTGEEFVLYTDIETDITDWLQQYQGKDLDGTELFSDRDETLETIGERFYSVLKERVRPKGYELVRLDIYENPVRTYSVSEKPVDGSINEHSAPISFLLGQAASEADPAQESAPGKETAQPALKSKPVLPVPPRIFAGEAPEENRERPKGRFPKLIAALLLLLLCSAGTVYLIKINGLYPGGYDVMYHLYRSDSLFHSIVGGDWYPLYDRFFYNGVQPLRYWPPLPVYVMSLCRFLTGNMLDSYLLYVGLIFFLGGCGWLTFGWKYNRIGISALVGVLWFFCAG
ncbi:MAG TPA: 6-pyruvoyl-tetrahydropterin synthase-related protein [Clostridia bacterium]|nr:6-pyruvoyl-tetrahydropterin synthase-related protein [Clostridia bacterium]